MTIVRSLFALATVLWTWVVAASLQGSYASEFGKSELANASHLETEKRKLTPKPPAKDPDKLHPEVADLALERIASRRIDIDGSIIQFNLFIDDQTEFAAEGPYSREELPNTIAETLRKSTALSLANVDIKRVGKRSLRKGRPLQVVLVAPSAANREGRFGDWRSPYVAGLCGSKKKGVASAKKPSTFQGMFLWPHVDTHAHTLIAVSDWDDAMVTLAHEATHYWYARLGLRGWWKVPENALSRIPEKSCAAKHLRYFEENSEPVDAYWRNQVFAELTEEAFAHDH